MGWGSGARADKMFADQFTEDGAGYLYRKGGKGEGYKVTTAERETFIAGFTKARRWMTWSIAGGTLLVVSGLVFTDIDPDSDTGMWTLYGLLGVVVALSLLWFRHAWSAPARALADRVAIADSLTRDEAQRAFLRRTSYWQLLVPGLTAVFLFLKFADGHDVTQGWSLLAPVLLAALIGLLLFRMFRKWRAERPDERA